MVVLVGAGLVLGIALSRGGRAPAKNLVDPSLLPQPGSQYVTMPDSTKLAANVLLPTSASEPNHERVPTILRLTRYALGWNQLDLVLRDTGFAIVNINERGTAASLGHLRMNADSYEADSGDIIRWIVDQPWSDGNVAAYGISADGAAAASVGVFGGHPVKAVAPLFIAADNYLDVTYPGGIFNEWFTKKWSDFVRTIDLQQPQQFDPSGVGTELAGALANEAIREHLDNLDSYSMAKRMPFRDDSVGGVTEIQSMIDRSGVAVYAIDGWFDNAFAGGAIAQFLAGKGPDQLTIGPWNHGGSQSLDPLQPQLSGPEPFYSEFERLVAWLKERVSSVRDSGRRHIRYYVLGEEKWRMTNAWPPPGARMVKFSLAAGRDQRARCAWPDTSLHARGCPPARRRSGRSRDRAASDRRPGARRLSAADRDRRCGRGLLRAHSGARPGNLHDRTRRKQRIVPLASSHGTLVPSFSFRSPLFL